MSPEINVFFYFLLFCVAFLYSSVGHGGASGYLALMAIFNFLPEVMKPTALLLNICVSVLAFISYYRGGFFSWRIFLPLAIASVPASFAGGLFVPDNVLYKHVLGVILLIPALRFLFPSGNNKTEIKKVNYLLAILIGGVIGFISGLLGIGGGIILSPLLLFLGWAEIKQVAAISALFIFVNSIAGLFGQMQHTLNFSASMYTMVTVAFAGGIAGSYSGAFGFPGKVLRVILSVVLLIASFKLIFT